MKPTGNMLYLCFIFISPLFHSVLKVRETCLEYEFVTLFFFKKKRDFVKYMPWVQFIWNKSMYIIKAIICDVLSLSLPICRWWTWSLAMSFTQHRSNFFWALKTEAGGGGEKSPHFAEETNECVCHTVTHLKPAIFNNNMLEKHSLQTQNNLFRQFAMVEFMLSTKMLTTNKKTVNTTGFLPAEALHQTHWRYLTKALHYLFSISKFKAAS